MNEESFLKTSQEDVSIYEPDNKPSVSGVLNWLLGLAGGIGGVVAGSFLYEWILRQGFYALILPGFLAGLGCSYLQRKPSFALSAVCGIIALIAGFYNDWRFFPFAVDQSLTFYVTHIHRLQPITLIMIGFGGLLGYWYPQYKK